MTGSKARYSFRNFSVASGVSLDLDVREQVAHDRGVGAAAQVDGQLLLEIVLVGLADQLQQGALARAVHVDEGLVDVPEDEGGVHAEKGMTEITRLPNYHISESGGIRSGAAPPIS